MLYLKNVNLFSLFSSFLRVYFFWVFAENAVFLIGKRRASIRIKFFKKSYWKEKKIKVIQWHYENEENVSKTAKNLPNDHKQVQSWVKEEEKHSSYKQ